MDTVTWNSLSNKFFVISVILAFFLYFIKIKDLKKIDDSKKFFNFLFTRWHRKNFPVTPGSTLRQLFQLK